MSLHSLPPLCFSVESRPFLLTVSGCVSGVYSFLTALALGQRFPISSEHAVHVVHALWKQSPHLSDPQERPTEGADDHTWKNHKPQLLTVPAKRQAASVITGPAPGTARQSTVDPGLLTQFPEDPGHFGDSC